VTSFALVDTVRVQNPHGYINQYDDGVTAAIELDANKHLCSHDNGYMD